MSFYSILLLGDTMALLSYSDEEIREFYRDIVALSIYNYAMLPSFLKDAYQQKLQNALSFQEVLGKSFYPTREEVFEHLQGISQEIKKVQEENQPEIDFYAEKIKDKLKEKCDTLESLPVKLEFLTDFLTHWMSYSEEAYRYCMTVPPTNGFYFDFYRGVPLSSSYFGLLVTRNGMCEDLANLFVFLAKICHLPVDSVSCTHGENLHRINRVLWEDKTASFIDLSELVRKKKTKKEAFLVSKEVLNQKGEYQLDNESDTVTIETSSDVDYDLASFLEELPTPEIVLKEEQQNRKK